MRNPDEEIMIAIDAVRGECIITESGFKTEK